MSLKLITETSFDCELLESKSKGAQIVGIYSSAGLKNNNGRIYDREVLAREITKIDEKAKDKTLWGELGHPPNPEINPERIAILTTMLEWKGDHVYGKSKVLDTPTGQIAKTLIKEGKLGISSRGLGTVSEQGHVNEDFNLITWDLVTDPSNHPSWVNGIFEGKTWASPDDVLVGIVNTNDRLNGLPKEQEIELILDRLQPILKCPKSRLIKVLDELTVPEKHQLNIAKKTLKMSDTGANIMGGMTKQEARGFLKKIGWSENKIKQLES